MRLGLDLRSHRADEALATAVEADRLGIWAVLVTAAPGAEAAFGAEIAASTEHVLLAVQFDATGAHPTALAEEIAVLDHLSRRRAIAVIDGDDAEADHVRRLLAGEVVDGAVLSPPPAQAMVPTWSVADLAVVSLPDDSHDARSTVDSLRDSGRTHAFADWAGSAAWFARHLATRVLTPDFPEIVADYADTIAPLDGM